MFTTDYGRYTVKSIIDKIMATSLKMMEKVEINVSTTLTCIIRQKKVILKAYRHKWL